MAWLQLTKQPAVARWSVHHHGQSPPDALASAENPLGHAYNKADALPRIAWFTPLPPAASGVSQYNVELLPALSGTFSIDVFVAVALQIPAAPAGTTAYLAHDFVWKHRRNPYDAVVYQMGNAPWHDYMWAYLVRYPGLVVLHDGQLHHARARSLFEQQREDDYRAEFEFDHPDADGTLAELGIAGLLGSLTYLWPMRRVVIQSASLVVVHNQWLAGQIREEQPDARVRVIEMGVPPVEVDSAAAIAIRARHRIPMDAILLVAFGEVTPEKRIPQAIQALASLKDAVPDAHLLLAGRPVPHYDAPAEALAAGVADRVTVAGYVAQEDVDAYLAAADICLCLRWPTSRETSAAWLRCLAAGRPTVITDLVHLVDIASLDPRSWRMLHARPTTALGHGEGETDLAPACVSIDILDEDHSLRVAMRRLATDAPLRKGLGEQARRLWRERFTLDRMVSQYTEILEEACRRPAPEPGRHHPVPAHFATNGTEHATALLRALGLPDSTIATMWDRVPR